MALPAQSGITLLYRADGTALLISGNALAAASGNGADAAHVLDIAGAAGQATTSITNGQHGGTGADAVVVAGAGGAVTGATGTTTGGTGGSYIAGGGNGGATASTGGTGGPGGSYLVAGAAGGDATAGSGTTHGGTGATATLAGGTGGNVVSAAGTAGNGGPAYVYGGAGGVGAPGTNGAAAPALLDWTGAAKRGGVAVGQGTVAAGYELDIAGKLKADNLQDGWTTWTPTLSQSAGVTITVNYAEYSLLGKVVFVQVSLTLTSGGTAGNQFIVNGVPAGIAPVRTGLHIPVGTFVYYDASANYFSGAVIAIGANDLRFVTNNNGAAGVYFGNVPAMTLASGDQLNFMASWKIA